MTAHGGYDDPTDLGVLEPEDILSPQHYTAVGRGGRFMRALPLWCYTSERLVEDKDIALRQFAGLQSPYARIARLCANEANLSSFANWIVEQVVAPETRMKIAAGGSPGVG